MEKTNVKEVKDSEESISMSLEDVKCSIKRWNDRRNEDCGFRALTLGFGMKITSREFDQSNWNREDLLEVHLYIGLSEEHDVWFHLVECIQGDRSVKDENLFILSKRFDKHMGLNHENCLESFSNEITEKEARDRNKAWIDNKESWFSNVKDRGNPNGKGRCEDLSVVRVFNIPNSDLINIFSENRCDHAIVFFGMKDYDMSKQKGPCAKINGIGDGNIEVIVAGIKGNKPEVFVNVTTPHPPFYVDYNKFKLLE